MWPFDIKWVPEIDLSDLQDDNGYLRYGGNIIINGERVKQHQDGGSRMVFPYKGIVIKVANHWQNIDEYNLWYRLADADKEFFAEVLAYGEWDKNIDFVIQARILIPANYNEWDFSPSPHEMLELLRVIRKYNVKDIEGRITDQAKPDRNGHWRIHDYGLGIW